MVGVDGSSPFAPTKFGRKNNHLAQTLGAFFLTARKKYGNPGCGKRQVAPRTPLKTSSEVEQFACLNRFSPERPPTLLAP